jgi:hypothetical protein
MLLDIDVHDGKLREIHSIRNPDKLRYRHLQLGRV